MIYIFICSQTPDRCLPVIKHFYIRHAEQIYVVPQLLYVLNQNTLTVYPPYVELAQRNNSAPHETDYCVSSSINIGEPWW